jgi:hypothetical protein
VAFRRRQHRRRDAADMAVVRLVSDAAIADPDDPGVGFAAKQSAKRFHDDQLDSSAPTNAVTWDVGTGSRDPAPGHNAIMVSPSIDLTGYRYKLAMRIVGFLVAGGVSLWAYAGANLGRWRRERWNA